MNVFIIGGTGYIGRTVSRQLLANGHAVVTLARSDEAAARAPAGTKTVRGDLTSLALIDSCSREADAVVYMALQGMTGIREDDKVAIATVLGALKGTGKAFVMTSGLAVYLGSQLTVASEDSPLSSVAPSQAWRAEMETMILGAAQDKVRTIVIRPPIVYGGESASVLVLATLAHARKSGRAFYIGDGANAIPVVHVDDLARAYEAALVHAPAGTALNVVAGTIYGKDLGDGIALAVGLKEGAESLTLEQASAAVGPLAPPLAMNLRVSGVRMASLLGWSARGPSLLHELTHGSLKAA